MKTLIVLLALVVALPAQEKEPMLPQNVFERAEKEWQSVSEECGELLRGLNERSLWEHSKHGKGAVYRFTWDPALKAHLAILRLEVEADGTGTLYLKLADKTKDPIQVIREASKKPDVGDVSKIQQAFLQTSDLIPYIPEHGLDGSTWLLEFSENGYYGVVLRISPEEQKIRTVGEILASHFDMKELKPLHGAKASMPSPGSS